MWLETIENKLRSIFEDTLDRLLYPGVSRTLSSQLVALILAQIEAQPEGKKKAPDQIQIFVSPEKWDAWQSAHDTLTKAALELENSLSAEGFHFKHQPQFNILMNPRLDVDAIEVKIGYTQDASPLEKTALQPVPWQPSEEFIPINAYLIINGKEQVPLQKAVINIGRRSTSDIILQDPMVSRDHAQLRAQQGYYLLFDLSSTGGTTINNHRIHTATLKPGDVIRMGKTILVYNQEISGVSDATKAAVIPSEPKE